MLLKNSRKINIYGKEKKSAPILWELVVTCTLKLFEKEEVYQDLRWNYKNCFLGSISTTF